MMAVLPDVEVMEKIMRVSKLMLVIKKEMISFCII